MTADAGKSLRAYAKHRGCSVQAVSKAVQKGRLRASVVRVNGKPRIADFALADAEWAGNTDLTKAPGYVKVREAEREAPVQPEGEHPGEDEPPLSAESSMAQAATADKFWSAKNKELAYRQASGELVNREAVEAAWTALVVLVRTNLLGVPRKAVAQRPQLAREDVAVFDALIRQALEELADASPEGTS